jgi:hypothetical protein
MRHAVATLINIGVIPAINSTKLRDGSDPKTVDQAFKSTPHSVVNSLGKQRLSIALSFKAGLDTVTDVGEFYGVNYPTKNRPIAFGNYRLQRSNKVFSYRNKQ